MQRCALVAWLAVAGLEHPLHLPCIICCSTLFSQQQYDLKVLVNRIDSTHIHNHVARSLFNYSVGFGEDFVGRAEALVTEWVNGEKK